MEGLLRALFDDKLDGQGQRRLLKRHNQNFSRRVSVLAGAWADEKDAPAISALTQESFAWFRAAQPSFDGLSAFGFALARDLPAEAFLYTWRNSATIEFLRRAGPEGARARFAAFAAARVHLTRDFRRMDSMHGGSLFGLPIWSDRRNRPNSKPGANVHPNIAGLSGSALIGAILEAVAVPLSRSEILEIAEREGGLEALEALAAGADLGAEIDPTNYEHAEEFAARVRRFCMGLSGEEVSVLRARGHAGEGGVRRPFREVARDGSRLQEERTRLIERRILEGLRDTFPNVEDLHTATAAIARWLASDEASAKISQPPPPETY